MRGIAANNEKGLPGLKDIHLTVHAGEIVGVAGVAGNGQRELCEVIAGLRRATAGKLALSGKDYTNRTPKEIIAAGVSYIPEDRLGTGLVPGLGIVDNLLLKDESRQDGAAPSIIDYSAASAAARALVRDYKIKAKDLSSPVSLMSGGNLQKLLFAREITADPRLIIAAYPVRGLDIEATAAVRGLLLRQREKGAAVLLISEDMDELFQLSDRIAVLYDGAVSGILNTDQTTVEEVGLLMVGSTLDKENAS
jgi:simple sugar transport system ATP-binding protein